MANISLSIFFCVELGKLLLAQEQYGRAEHWLKQAQKKYPEDATFFLAMLYGFSKSSDLYAPSTAKTLFINLTNNGDRKSAQKLVQLIKAGSINTLNANELSTLQQKAKANLPGACYVAATIAHKNSEAPLVTKQYLQCAFPTYPTALYDLASLTQEYTTLGTFEDIEQLIPILPPKNQQQLRIRLAKAIASNKFAWPIDYAETLLLGTTGPDAQYHLAKLYLQNPIFGKSSQEILALLKQCQLDNSALCYGLEAQMYIEGNRVVQNPWVAENILLNAPLDHAYISYLLGEIYINGYLGHADITMGLAYLRSAANQNFTRAHKKLADVFFEGRGLRVDKKLAYAHLLLSSASISHLAVVEQKYAIDSTQKAMAAEFAQTMGFQPSFTLQTPLK